MTYAEYEQWMCESDPLVGWMCDKGDGTCLIVKRLMFHWTLLQSVIGDQTGYDDRWCYDTGENAIAAAVAWIATGAPEPQGWHRHHRTGRRRPDGDATREYINH